MKSEKGGIINFILNRPHFVMSIILAFTVLGIIGYKKMTRKLFPDVDKPQVAVVVIEHGASAKDMADNIAIPIERELYKIDKVRKVYSTSKDEVSVITAEFEYKKKLGEAATDVNNALSKVRALLPKDIEAPQIYKISSATPPVIVLSVYPKTEDISLADVRQICENKLRNELLTLKEVANVDVFGGYRKDVFIEIDKDKLNKFHLSLPLVLAEIKKTNIDLPVGFIVSKEKQFLIKANNKADMLSKFKNIQITKDIKLSEIAKIKYDYLDNTALYYGNGHPAIALAVERDLSGDTLRTISAVKKMIPKFKQEFPDLNFQISDSQEKIVKLSNLNMIEALRDAIIMTTLVIFFFLANIRQMIIAALSIPFVYGITISIMWITGMEFDIVTLSAIIVALGMLVDDAIVVLENIERHLHEEKEPMHDAVVNGTKEVVFAVMAGTIATSAVLIPLLFVGDYPQQIFRPFATTLLISLWVSYFVSISFIPLAAPYLLKRNGDKNKFEKMVYFASNLIVNPLRNFYSSVVKAVFKRKFLFFPLFIPMIILFILSMKKIIPIVGKELMPPMDTGIVKANITCDSNLSIYGVENVVKKIATILSKDKRLEMSSIAVGSEPGVFTMGSGKSPQSISMTLNYIDRFHRKASIWEIERELRRNIWKIPGIKYVDIFDYGATPFSSIRGNLDVMISGNDLKILDKIANKIKEKAFKVRGLTSVSRNWDYDKITYNLKIDEKLARFYGVTLYDVVSQLSTKIRGTIVSIYNIPNEQGLKVRVIFQKKDRNSIPDLNKYYIDTPRGKIPANTIMKIEKIYEPTVITRQKLNYTVDVIGFREKAAISHIMESFKEIMKGGKLPPGYSISQEGDIKQLKDSLFRMVKAIGIGMILLFFALAPPFNSFLSPIAVIFAIPLSMIGASWAVLVMGYHQCMPGLMGIILLAGVITKNSILLVDFIQHEHEAGMELKTAITESIRLRTRPVLMTAFGTSVGLIPIALGWALGLERLAPLGTVAIGGLLVGTFLTLIYVPLFYFFMSRLKRKR